MTIVSIVVILLLCLVLIKASDWVVVAIRRLSHILGIGTLAIASLVLALATSFPELFVGVTAGLGGTPSLSLGNVVGANIANLSLVLGLAGIFGGVVYIKNVLPLEKDLGLALVAGVLPIVLLLDRQLSRVDGAILLAVYGLYAWGLFHERFLEIGKVQDGEPTWQKFLREIETGRGEARQELVRLFAAMAVMLLAAYFIVIISGGLAKEVGVPVFLVGLLIVSVGTTLPELAFSYRSIRDHAPTLLLGNSLGSIIVNATLILGLVALISPISISARREYLLATIFFLLVVFLFWLFIRTKHRLDRWEAAVLLLGYLVFIILEVLGFNPFGFLLK